MQAPHIPESRPSELGCVGTATECIHVQFWRIHVHLCHWGPFWAPLVWLFFLCTGINFERLRYVESSPTPSPEKSQTM